MQLGIRNIPDHYVKLNARTRRSRLARGNFVCWITLVLLFSVSSKADQFQVAVFSASSLTGWETKAFSGTTSYQFIDLNNKRVLAAESRNSASGLIKKVQVDLKDYPYLSWSWRIENRLNTENEKIKSGDDYAARIYVVIDGGILPWRTRTLCYVWANGASKGEIWPNAFVGKNAMMMALKNREDNLSTWYSEKRNVYDDLKRVFGDGFHSIDAVALMTDTDNSHGQATAYYGDIYFSKR